MLRDLSQFYKIGKELGLKRNEINRIFLSSGRHSLLFKIVMVIIFAILAVVIVIAVIVGGVGSQSTYASGTYYSTVKPKDFVNKK